MWALLVSVLACSGVAAAPYPPQGLSTEWIQPDGTVLSLKLYGDEFYARTATADGYTVVYSEADNAYYYAEPAVLSRSLVSSRVSASRPPPPGLPKHLLEPPSAVAAMRERHIRKYAPERAARWERKKEAVKRQRVQSPAPAASSDPGAPLSGIAPLASAVAVGGSRVGLVILVQFPDDPATAAYDPTNFPTTQAKMARYSNEIGYSDDGNTGSIRDYFADQSYGQLDFTQLVTAVVTLPHPRHYYNYSNYPTNTVFFDTGTTGRMLVTDAIGVLQSSAFDFAALTLDPLDRVVATSLMFAGGLSGVWAKGLWPHAWSLRAYLDVGTPGDPRYIYDYQVTNVPNAAPVIGTMCHELGHLLLDYPDFYDTDPSDGASEGVGEHSLMGSGNYLNGGRTPAPIDLYLKDISGWAAITDLTLNVPLQGSLAAGGYGYRVRKPGSSTEYFLIENRSDDDRWSGYAPDRGIVIWHVDEAVTTDNRRQQMTASSHYELSLEQADGMFDLEANRDRGDAQDLYESFLSFSDTTVPASNWWSGVPSGLRLQVLNAGGSPTMYMQFFSEVVQLPVDEALDTAGLDWSQDGLTFAQGSWFGELSSAASDSVDHATHYPIGDAGQASVSTQLTGPGSLTFHWRVSSELHGDYLGLYWNDLQHPGVTPISGDSGWQQRTVVIPPGSHTLRWTYAKNGALSAGADAGWLDQVAFTPGPPDADGDGLSDDEEALLGSNPASVDSDGDGLVDGTGWLVLLSSYPGGIDGNSDGFVDGEADYNTDPTASNTGDVAPLGNPDNRVDLGDLFVLTRMVMRMVEPGPLETALGDVDGDGDLDIADLLLLQVILQNPAAH